MEPQIGSLEYTAGDRIVLVTDGVVDGLWDRAIDDLSRHALGPYANLPAAQRLVSEAVAESGRDNSTALVVEGFSLDANPSTNLERT